LGKLDVLLLKFAKQRSGIQQVRRSETLAK
jgi:hypothetical protein